MRKWTLILLLLVVIALIGGLLYRFPPIHQRLSWRVDFAMAYLRGLIDPVEPVPTALPHAQVLVTTMPTSAPTPTLVPSPTPTVELTPTPLPTATPLPRLVSLPAPEYEKQDINNCGPASLTMYLRYYGWEGIQDDISGVLKPNVTDRNVNVEELAFYVRTRRLAEYRLSCGRRPGSAKTVPGCRHPGVDRGELRTRPGVLAG